MGVSLSVLELNNYSEEFFETEESEISAQDNFDSYDEIEASRTGLSNPETTIIRQNSPYENVKIFSVKMRTQTIDEPIYVYLDEPKVIEDGYQEIEKFKFWLDESSNELYVFSKKKVVKEFVRRLNDENLVESSPVMFDFSRINELNNLVRATGTWEDSTGAVRRIAKFGVGIDEEIDEEDYESITTFYIDYKYQADTTKLILSEEGRISTKQKLEYRDLYSIFQEVRDIIVT